MGLITRFFKKQENPVPELKESAKTYADWSFISGSRFLRENPDLLVTRKGGDIYKRMLRDAQVKSAYDLLIGILISRNFRFEKTLDNEVQKELEDFFHYNLAQMKSTWSQAMRSVLLAKAQGFSISEKVYRVGKFGGKDKWMLDAIKARPYETFKFKADDYGNIKAVIQTQENREKKLDPNKFIIFVNHPEMDPLYGESDLRSVYRPYWEKDNILKFWNIHLERVAGGFTVAQADVGAPILSAAEKADFENVLRNITQATAIRVPAGYKIDIVHSPDTEAFEKAVQHRDKQIAKGLMIPNLLGFSEQGAVGSNAQAQTQLETFFFVIKQQGEMLEDALNEQLFKELAWWNYGVEDFPRFVFEEFTQEQKRQIAMAWSEAVTTGIVKNTFEDEQRTRELLSYDPREQDETDEEEGVVTTPPESKSPKPAPPPSAVPEDKVPDPDKVQEMAEDEAEDPRIMRRVNLSDFELSFADNEMNFYDAMSDDIDNMFADVVESVTALVKRLPDKEETDIEGVVESLDKAISPKVKSSMNQTIRKFLRLSYEDGRRTAQDIINDASADAPTEKLKERIQTASALSKRTAVKIKREDQEHPWESYSWSVQNFTEGLSLDTAEKYFMAKAFWITGDLSEEMVSKAKAVILNAIREELPIEVVVDQLTETLSPLVDKVGRPRLETIVRTNLSDAFTQAQLAVYSDPDLGDFVRALRYSAIIDRRTTQFCDAMNGAIYDRDDPIWRSITPPNHFNCRSVLIPVTRFDRYRVSERPTLQPKPGFG